MPLPIGARLGPYEVVSPLGAGGMGEVYRAHDARLGRDVALKVIAPDLAHDPDRVARFAREARAASALADAHIVQVFDVGEEAGVQFFASELVEGPTLHQLLLDGALPVRKALELAAQIAQGLAAAHEKGIVHRDLKPENVLIAPGNVAKIADFGLAKSVGGGLVGGAGQSESGTLIGTVTYMSPEQAAGKRVDGRSDQFALGSMLFEMLTGRALFRRATPAETMTAILREEADLGPLAALQIPPSVEWILERCLSKDPEGRYASTKDLARELAHLRERTSALRSVAGAAGAAVGVPGAGAGAPRTMGRRIPPLLLLAAGVLLGGLATGAVLHRRPPATAAGELRFLLPPPPGASFVQGFDNVELAVSPDGERLAFIAADGDRRSVWMRAFDDSEPHRMPGTEGARSLFWSPDGRALGFFSGDRLLTIATDGRAPVRVCEVPAGAGFAATWGRDGTIAYVSVAGEALYRVAATGGTPAVWHARDEARGEVRLGWPQWIPGSDEVAFTVRGADGTSRLAALGGDGVPRPLGPIASRFEFLDAKTLVHARDGALVAQVFDRQRGLAGAPRLLAPVVNTFRSSLWAGFAVSPAGTLAWQAAEDDDELVFFDRTGKRETIAGSTGSILSATIAYDGHTILSARKRPELGTYDVWAFDSERGTESRLTSDPETEFSPLLAPDGKTLYYSAVGGVLPRIVVRDLASGAEHDLLGPGGFQMAQSISRDGRLLAFSRSGDQGFGLWTLSLDGRAAPEPFASGARAEEVRLSPDGEYGAFISNETGVGQLYLARVGASAERIAVSARGARSVSWREDGRELLYLSADQQVIAVPVRTSPRLELGQAQTLFAVPPHEVWTRMTASPDGRRILAIVRRQAADEQPLQVQVGARPGA